MTLTLVQDYIKRKLDNGVPINSDMINKLISDHKETKVRTLKLYERYKGDKTAIPIFSREFENDTSKINSKLNNDFFSEIIDVKQGYLIGKPIVYSLDRNRYISDSEQVEELYYDMKPKEDYSKHSTLISRLSVLNNFVDLDAELVKLVSICGHAGREIYIDNNGEIRVVNLLPFETIFLTNVHGEVEYALRYYKELDDNGEEITKVEFFDNNFITYFKSNANEYEFESEKQHMFNTCPIVKVVNNNEELGDCEKVIELIDGYDRTISDVSSEIEQFRLAYMYFKGKEPTPETIEMAKKTGGFYVGEDGEVGFITKKINDDVVEHHLNRLEDNILRFSKSVNFNDEAFAGNLSGVAMKYKLFALESKAVVLENKLQSALRNQFRIVTNILKLQNITLDYLDLFFEFKRNLPINMQDEVQANAMLVGIVSERTRLAQLPFIDNVDYELKQMRMDKIVSNGAVVGNGEGKEKSLVEGDDNVTDTVNANVPKVDTSKNELESDN